MGQFEIFPEMLQEKQNRAFSFSDEQELFVREAKKGHNILVDACVGSGKTTAIQYLCGELPDNFNILYLTYNKLLKVDAQSKIKGKNVTVTNYHGFASMILNKMGIHVGMADLIQRFNLEKPRLDCYDVLVLDEYQDIEQELAEMLEHIKLSNPEMQIIAVGDMKQKIYDKTTLDVQNFVEKFLGTYKQLEFTRCFRLSALLAETLGRIWGKRIVGANDKCIVEQMDMASFKPKIKKQALDAANALRAMLTDSFAAEVDMDTAKLSEIRNISCAKIRVEYLNNREKYNRFFAMLQ